MKLKTLLLSLTAIVSFSLCSCSLKGEQGEKGNDGSSLLSGEGVPDSSLGNDGDSYVDSLTFDYYLKENGSWTQKGNMKGDTGSSVLSGTGTPDSSLGKDGDSYIDYSTFDFYLKEDGSWNLKGNIKGESAYETYLKYHPGYSEDEEAWINELAQKGLYNHIVFNTYGGTSIDDYYFYRGDTINIADFVSPERTRAKFLGWYYDSSYSNAVTSDFIGGDNITLFAKYDTDKINVSFLKDGSNYDSIQIDYGSPLNYALPSASLGYKMTPWTNPETGEVWTSDKIVKQDNLVLETHTVVDQLELPIVSINTATGGDVTSKDDYIGATFSITGINGSTELSETSGKIRGRGNSSWYNSEKKSYKIKFDKKVSLFGSSHKDKTWTLIANQFDKTLSRNYLADELSSRFDGLDFTSMHQYVDVYLNGSYNGVYLLCDQIEIGSGRVDVDDTVSSDGNMGYLVELDGNNGDGGNQTNDFLIGTNRYEIKNFDPGDAEYAPYGDVFKNYLKDYMQKCLTAIKDSSWEEVNSLIDVDSFADSYLVDEIMGNPDAGMTSCFFYKDKDGKLFKGPIWDYDNGGGNCDYRLGTKDGCPADGRLISSSNCWYSGLLERGEFLTLIKEKLVSYRSRINEAFQCVNVNNSASCYNKYCSALNRNFERWNIMGVDIGSEPFPVVWISTLKGQFEYLYDWMQNRYQYVCNCYDAV